MGLKTWFLINSLKWNLIRLYTFFHDDRNNPYCLVATDYAGGYVDAELPCDFEYDYYPDSTVKFHAICNFLYVKCATKKLKAILTMTIY